MGPVLLQRLGRSGTAWTQVYKALVAIEHLVLHSSPEWVSWAVEVAGPCICQLQTFQHVDSEDQDWVRPECGWAGVAQLKVPVTCSCLYGSRHT